MLKTTTSLNIIVALGSTYKRVIIQHCYIATLFLYFLHYSSSAKSRSTYIYINIFKLYLTRVLVLGDKTFLCLLQVPVIVTYV